MAELHVQEGSKFDGMKPRGGFFPDLKEMTLRVIVRDGLSYVAPFDDRFQMMPGDTIVVAATRPALTEALKGEPAQFHPQLGQDWERFETALAEPDQRARDQKIRARTGAVSSPVGAGLGAVRNRRRPSSPR